MSTNYKSILFIYRYYNMNIVEAYIKFNKQLIILISGLSGSKKTKIASDIKQDFNIKKIDIESYCVKNNDVTVKLSNDIVVTDWDHVDTYNWDDINDEINRHKSDGVVICGPYFPLDKLKFESDFHIHIKISKQQLIEKRREYIKNNPEKCKELLSFVDTPTETLIINTITYPHYLKYLKESKIDKFVNANELTENQIYDQTVDFLFFKIQEYLDKYNEKIQKSNKHDSHSSSDISDDSSNHKNDDEPIHVGTTYDVENLDVGLG